MKQQNVRVFCYEENLGLIEDGNFYPLQFSPIRFMRILVRLMSKKDYIAPDLVLKEAMMEYTSVTAIAKIYKTKSLSDSLFYMKWRSLIKNNKKFDQKQKALQKKRGEWAAIKRKGQREGDVVRQARREAFMRTVKKVPQY